MNFNFEISEFVNSVDLDDLNELPHLDQYHLPSLYDMGWINLFSLKFCRCHLLFDTLTQTYQETR